jgi:hypothetical protein
MKNIRLINLTSENIKLEDIIRIEKSALDTYFYLYALKNNIYSQRYLYTKCECLGIYGQIHEVVLFYSTNKITFMYYYI